MLLFADCNYRSVYVIIGLYIKNMFGHSFQHLILELALLNKNHDSGYFMEFIYHISNRVVINLNLSNTLIR